LNRTNLGSSFTDNGTDQEVRDQETDGSGGGSGSGGLSIDGGRGGRNGVFENGLSDEGVGLRGLNEIELSNLCMRGEKTKLLTLATDSVVPPMLRTRSGTPGTTLETPALTFAFSRISAIVAPPRPITTPINVEYECKS